MSAVTLGFEIVGIEHSPIDLAVYAVGWTIGWLLLWKPRQIPAATNASRGPVAVVIPARNEADSLPHLLRPLVAQRRDGDQIVVVNDHSTDATARVAAAFGVSVLVPPQLPQCWLGKPHACWHAAEQTSPATFIFLDADTRPGPTLLDDLAARVAARPDRLVSIQPWHAMETVSEQPSILCNVTALMGCGAFTIAGPRLTARVAFGPVIAVDRSTYVESGGHAAGTVRAMHTEDIALARAIGDVELFVGAPRTTKFRMYPNGLFELIRGWTRSIATGVRFTSWWIALATLAWVCSLAGGWIAAPIVYPLSAIQVWVLGRRAGTTDPVAALFFPVLVVCFVVIFIRSAFAVVFKRRVEWKGRSIDPRPA